MKNQEMRELTATQRKDAGLRTGIARGEACHHFRLLAIMVQGLTGTLASMDLIIPGPFRARHWVGWDAAIRTGATRYAAGRLLAVPALHKGGRRISIEFSIQFIKDVDAQVKWVVAIIRDVTEPYVRDKALRVQLASFTAMSAGWV
jgi:hypothetical protein